MRDGRKAAKVSSIMYKICQTATDDSSHLFLLSVSLPYVLSISLYSIVSIHFACMKTTL